jgi:hypothetical protein
LGLPSSDLSVVTATLALLGFLLPEAFPIPCLGTKTPSVPLSGSVR